jgi:type III restriction enzyme
MMKLKFDPSLAYQSDAVNAVSDVFVGQPIGQAAFEISSTLPSGVEFTELGVGNHLVLDDAQFLTNVRAVQERNGIERTEALQGREFSIEMETGTGKTYVSPHDLRAE